MSIRIESKPNCIYRLIKLLAGIQVARGKISAKRAGDTLLKYGHTHYIVIGETRVKVSWQAHQLLA